MIASLTDLSRLALRDPCHARDALVAAVTVRLAPPHLMPILSGVFAG